MKLKRERPNFLPPHQMTVSISPVRTAQDKRAFLDLPYRAYGQDPNWRAPLRMMQSDQLSPKKNVALDDMEHELFLARRNGEVVGRIAAIVNGSYLARYQNQTGHFGFLDTLEPDPELVSALLAQAENYLKARDMRRMLGPFNFSINEECGLLVDGFDTPPMILMPHGRPDYASAFEATGLKSIKETFALRYKFGPDHATAKRIDRIKQAALADPNLTIRPLDMRNFKAEIALIMDMFNDAWSQNWEFVPFSEAQITHMAKELRPLVTEQSFRIAEYKGEAIAFAVFLPDLNELADGLDGRLLPFGWLQLLYRLKIRGPKRARLPLAGLRQSHQKTRRGLLAAIGSFEAAIEAQRTLGVEEIEASWVLEDNDDLMAMCLSYGFEKYKTYRIYEKSFE
ncbi:MAG: hypothetical protein ABJ327_21645 [Litoreibacter sp.]